MLLGQPLVVFRTTNGQPAVLEDRCAHRHAPLSAGRVCSGELECPYHGWRYGGSGEVKRVPALGEATAPPDVGVTAMPAVEQSVGDRVRYHIRTGGHDITRDDWAQYLATAKAQLS